MNPIIIPILLASPVALHAADAVPQISWASDPVRPDETVLIIGEGFEPGSQMELAQLGNEPATAPQTGSAVAASQRELISPLETNGRSLKAVVPKLWPQGVWECRVRLGNAVSAPVLLNVPAVWWWNGDGGESACPGGWVRVFGKSLNWGGKSRAMLRNGAGRFVDLPVKSATPYAMDLAVPADVARGNYELFVHNGLGGDAAWSSAGTVMIRTSAAWKDTVFHVKDFGPKPAEALAAALKKAEENGGGIVYLPRGRYPVKEPLRIPLNTVLRGESTELVSLHWPDYDQPPADLITGVDFGIESLTIYCQHHKNVVTAVDESRCFFLRKVRIRANCYFMIETPEKEFRGRKGPASHLECGAGVWARGRNFEITGCDIYTSGYAVMVSGAQYGVIARNQIRGGRRCYRIENTERLLVENNFIVGNNLVTMGNDMGTFRNEYPNRCCHIYYANNRMEKFFGSDREVMTLDATSGAYFGTLAAVDGLRVTLAKDPEPRDYATMQNKPARSNWMGAVLQVLAGKGEGQYRFVTAHEGREWRIDRPWTVQPDTQSLVGIVPFRGQSLFIGNVIEDGGPFQLYGAAHECIVAENKGSRLGGPMGDGFTVWGLNGRGWGHQASWYCQFLDNQILEGNGYGPRVANFGTIAHDKSNTFNGPMVRGALFRRNTCRNNSGFDISGATADVMVEHSTICDTEIGIKVAAKSERVLLRDNQFVNVAKPVEKIP